MSARVEAPALPLTSAEGPRHVNGAIPRLSGDIRPLIPKLGLRNYWYPALRARSVGWRKPVKAQLLGEELCLFRGTTGDVVAIQDVCPHRGARLSEGNCHYRGTVACPYHGWVYDESGKNVAVLSEGPTSGVCGKPGTEAKTYPTRTLKGVVFVWIGEGDPAPIEEDVPEEFFHEDALVLTGQVYWRCNWEVALENSMDSHVNYVHRDALVVARAGFIARGAQGEHPIFVGNVVCDVTDESQVEAMVGHVGTTYGGVDILVNNAGILGGLSVLEIPLERWNRQLAVNLTGTFLCTKHVARRMVDDGRKGSIIVIVSTAGHQGQAGNIGYSTSKSGLLNFTRAAAMDLARHGIRVNSLTPTATDTEERARAEQRLGPAAARAAAGRSARIPQDATPGTAAEPAPLRAGGGVPCLG